MATALPMLQTYRNVGTFFERILAAKQPDAFTHKFLYDTIGLKAVGDRPLIAFLRTLGFLDPAVNRQRNTQSLRTTPRLRRRSGELFNTHMLLYLPQTRTPTSYPRINFVVLLPKWLGLTRTQPARFWGR